MTWIDACGSGYLDGGSGWRSALIVVKTEMVIEWHRQGFQGVLELEWIPPGRQGVVDIVNKSAETQRAVAGLLPKRIRKRAEKAGKLGPQAVESSEINVMEKTLNQ